MSSHKTRSLANAAAQSLLVQLPGGAGDWAPHVWQNGLWFAEIRHPLPGLTDYHLCVAQHLDGTYQAFLRNPRGVACFETLELRETAKTVPLALTRLYRLMDAGRDVIAKTNKPVLGAVEYFGDLLNPILT